MKTSSASLGRGIFGEGSNFESRCFTDYKKLAELVGHVRALGMKIVLTQGSYDLVHIGHARYLEEAKRRGDFLVVGVDSDAKIRSRKGPDRPIVPQSERLEILTHLRCVDVVMLKGLKDKKWNLIKTIRPDVLIATKETYNKDELRELRNYCGKVVVLDPMATTTTSAKIRLMQIKTAHKLERSLTPKLLETIQNVLNGVK